MLHCLAKMLCTASRLVVESPFEGIAGLRGSEPVRIVCSVTVGVDPGSDGAVLIRVGGLGLADGYSFLLRRKGSVEGYDWID